MVVALQAGSIEMLVAPPPAVGSARILVVDDLIDNRRVLARALARLGHEAVLAENGEEALAHLNEATRFDPVGVDLVLLDVEMPVMNGVELLGRMKGDSRLSSIPVVMVSAVDDLRTIAACIELGADDYLPKPFDPLILAARVRSSLERKRLHDWEVCYLRQLEQEEAQSERLISSMLPEAIAVRLKRGEAVIADYFEDASVMFADIVSFTARAATTDPAALVTSLNTIFSSIDRAAARHRLEKIKTIGDAYMVVGGLPVAREGHLESIAELALDLVNVIAPAHGIELRVGVHHGPVVAGVIGAAKPSYDVWGDTVNVASRMESHGEPSRIHVTDEVRRRLGERFVFQARGAVDLKGRGPMTTYFLTGRAAARGTP